MATDTRSPTTTRYVRWGGLAAILGPVLILTGTAVGTVAGGDAGLAQFGDTASFFVATSVGWVGTVLVVLGLISLYAVQAEEAGGFGLFAFVAAMVGMITLGALLTATPIPFSSILLVAALVWMGYQVLARRLDRPATTRTAPAREEGDLEAA